MTLVDITFHANTEYADTTQLLQAQSVSLVYVEDLRKKMEVVVIKHIGNPQTIIRESPGYRFFKGSNGVFSIPFAAIYYLRKKKPDIVMVQGLKFPVQVLALKCFLGKDAKIILKHHADRPFTGIKKIFQKLADHYIDGYLFSSKGNASEWVDAGIVKSNEKVFELPPTLTDFKRQDKILCRKKLGFTEGLHYLWVGRLNANKDPETVLKAFEKFLIYSPQASLHLIYSTAELMGALNEKVNRSPLLRKAVHFEGYIPNEQLQNWYSAADFLISSSYTEGGSVSILEAMACGCIPVVSAIPASMKAVENGAFGLYFQAGDSEELLQKLHLSVSEDRDALSLKIESHFQNTFSIKSVNDKLYRLCLGLTDKQLHQ